MLNDYEGKRIKMKKGAETVFYEMKNKVGLENMEKVLKSAFTEE